MGLPGHVLDMGWAVHGLGYTWFGLAIGWARHGLAWPWAGQAMDYSGHELGCPRSGLATGSPGCGLGSTGFVRAMVWAWVATAWVGLDWPWAGVAMA